MGLIQAGMGIAQTVASAIEAGNLPDDKPYTVGSELRGAFNEAKGRSNEGLSLATRRAAEQDLARQGTAAKQMFRNFGMAGAGAAAANIMGVDAINRLATLDQQQRNFNFGNYLSTANRIQGVQDQETQRFNTQLNMERQALGGAMQSGIGNIMGGINTGINAGQMKQAADIYGGIANKAGGNYLGNQQQTGFNNASLMSGGGSRMSGPYSPYTFEGGGVPFQYAGQQSTPQAVMGQPTFQPTSNYQQFMPQLNGGGQQQFAPQFNGGGQQQAQPDYGWLNSGPLVPNYLDN